MCVFVDIRFDQLLLPQRRRRVSRCFVYKVILVNKRISQFHLFIYFNLPYLTKMVLLVLLYYFQILSFRRFIFIQSIVYIKPREVYLGLAPRVRLPTVDMYTQVSEIFVKTDVNGPFRYSLVEMMQLWERTCQFILERRQILFSYFKCYFAVIKYY